MIAQSIIAIFGVLAVWLSQDPRPERARWACIFGLMAQPAWMWATWEAGQFGIFALSFVYAWSWARGVKTYWMKR